MLTEKQGIKAIIDLMILIGTKESYASAKLGWKSMSDNEKEQIELAHKRMCGGFK